jgi:hypothetical protein
VAFESLELSITKNEAARGKVVLRHLGSTLLF